MPDYYDRDWRRREDFMSRHPLLAALGWILGIVVVCAVVAGVIGLISTGSVIFQGKAAKITNPARVEQKVYDPNNTIAQIAFFHDQCQAVNRQLRIIENNRTKQKADERAARFAKDPIRQQQAQDALSQDSSDVSGAENNLQATVADYNSRSAQSTANVFKGHNLPERIVIPDPIPPGFSINCG